MAIVNRPNTYTSDTTIIPAQVNDDFDTLYDAFNGGIDDANIADDSIITSKIADSNITTDKIADSSVTAVKIANRTRTVMFDTRADGSGGAVDGQNEGSPETAFTGTPTGYIRGRLIVPNDYVSGTTAVIKLVMRATNTGTHSSVHYVGCRSSATTTSWTAWNEQSGITTGSLGFVAAQMYTQSVYTIPSTNLSTGAFVTVAYRISTAITGTIYGLAMYLEYTSDS